MMLLVSGTITVAESIRRCLLETSRDSQLVVLLAPQHCFNKEGELVVGMALSSLHNERDAIITAYSPGGLQNAYLVFFTEKNQTLNTMMFLDDGSGVGEITKKVVEHLSKTDQNPMPGKQ